MPDFLDREIGREGGDTLTNDPLDKGGLTRFGISQSAHPDIDVANLTYPEARAIFERKYIDGPGFGQLAPSPLRDQLIDFGITSGPAIAIKKLQLVLGITADGDFGHDTLTAIRNRDVRVLNNQLLAKRVQMIADLVSQNPSQVRFLRGWVSRALEFLDAS